MPLLLAFAVALPLATNSQHAHADCADNNSEGCWYALSVRFLHNILIIAIGFAALAKTLWELSHSEALFILTAWPAAPGAHLAGLIAGLLLCAFITLQQRLSSSAS